MFHLLIYFCIEGVFLFLEKVFPNWTWWNHWYSKTLRYNRVSPSNENEKILFKRCLHRLRRGFIEIGEDKFLMPQSYIGIADQIEDFEVRDSDVWIIAHPKSGSICASDMVRKILSSSSGKNENIYRCTLLESEGNVEFPMDRFVRWFFTFPKVMNFVAKKFPITIGSLKGVGFDDSPRRLLKTYLPWKLLPKALRERTTKAKIIYVTREPKDTLIDFFHCSFTTNNFTGTFDEFCQLFMSGRTQYGPYWRNISSYCQRRNDEDILFLKHEDMEKDLLGVVETAGDFLIGKPLKDEQMRDIVRDLGLNNKRGSILNLENSLLVLLPVIGLIRKVFRKKKDEAMQKMSLETEKSLDEWIDENKKLYKISF